MPGESSPCSGVGLSLSPATSSRAGLCTPGQLQRQQSCKTRPVFAQDIASLSVPILGSPATLPPPGRAGDRHPTSPPEHGGAQGPTAPPSAVRQHARSSLSTAATTSITKSSHRSYLKTLNPRAHTHGTSRPERILRVSVSTSSRRSLSLQRKKENTNRPRVSLTDLSSCRGSGSHMSAAGNGCSSCPRLSQPRRARFICAERCE